MKIIHSRVQHAVGQGSFHSACIELRQGHESEYRYDYIYDCGALEGPRQAPALARSIKRLDLTARPDSGGQLVIDALVMSHLDCDHFNGADLLAAMFLVRRVFMPYLGADELMLVLASQAERLKGNVVQELHGLATGAGDTLFGVPVTQVQPDDNVPPRPGTPGGNQDPPRGPQVDAAVSDEDKGERLGNGGPPGNLTMTAHGSGAAIGSSIVAQVSVAIGAPAQPASWTLRFWNRGVDDELLAYVFEGLVACEFPLHALNDSAAVQELTDWLAHKDNRKAALAAYREAIQKYKPDWYREASGAKLANFLSLGMFSGPANLPEAAKINYWVYPSDDPSRHRYGWPGYWRDRASQARTGWIGTGDAPLGEAQIWADFSKHFTNELAATQTVQVPHHGAAPKDGPRFFNPALISAEGMNAVISVGTTNTHGHPTTQVIKEVLAARGNLEVVTEESWAGFHEVLRIDV